MLTVTSVYAGLLGLLFLMLSFRVIALRRKQRVGIGDGDGDLLRRHRVHANFAEYVPLALLLVAFCELQGLPLWAVHAMGLCLVAGRSIHAWGVSQAAENLIFRVTGMSLTFAVIATGALANLVLAAM